MADAICMVYDAIWIKNIMYLISEKPKLGDNCTLAYMFLDGFAFLLIVFMLKYFGACWFQGSNNHKALLTWPKCLKMIFQFSGKKGERKNFEWLAKSQEIRNLMNYTLDAPTLSQQNFTTSWASNVWGQGDSGRE